MSTASPEEMKVYLGYIRALIPGDPLKAAHAVQTIRRSLPEDPEVIYIQALAESAIRSFSTARKHALDLLRLVPENQDAKKLLDAINAESRKPLPIHPTAVFDATKIIPAQTYLGERGGGQVIARAVIGRRQRGVPTKTASLIQMPEMFLLRPYGVWLTPDAFIIEESVSDMEQNELVASILKFDVTDSSIVVVDEPCISLLGTEIENRYLWIREKVSLAISAEQLNFSGKYLLAADCPFDVDTLVPYSIPPERVIRLEKHRDYRIRQPFIVSLFPQDR